MYVTNKTVLITGAANGLGFGYVEELLKHGAKCVAILDLPNSNGHNAVAKLEATFGKGRVIFIECDVSDAKQLEASFEKVIQNFKVLDILINNAGIMNDARWELAIQINYTAVVRGTFLGLKYMSKHNGGQGGTIVNISSLVGLAEMPSMPVYCGTKFGVLGFTMSLRSHYPKTGVRVLTMCPGATDTQLILSVSHRFLDEFITNEEGLALISQYPIQPTKKVTEGMIQLLEKGKNGAICVINGNEAPYTVEFPHYKTLKKIPL